MLKYLFSSLKPTEKGSLPSLERTLSSYTLSILQMLNYLMTFSAFRSIVSATKARNTTPLISCCTCAPETFFSLVYVFL